MFFFSFLFGEIDVPRSSSISGDEEMESPEPVSQNSSPVVKSPKSVITDQDLESPLGCKPFPCVLFVLIFRLKANLSL